MKFKMRVLHFSPNGNAEQIARAIAKIQEAKSDQIPPAYPSENEKLVIIGVELKGSSADKTVVDLCRDLTTARAKNVAFYAIGSGDFSAVNELKKIVSDKGINVAGNTFECTVKGGLFKKGKVTDEDVSSAVKWADEIVESLAV